MDIVLNGYSNALEVKAALDFSKQLKVQGENMLLPLIELSSTHTLTTDSSCMVDTQSGTWVLTIDAAVNRFEVSDIKGNFNIKELTIDLGGGLLYTCDSRNATYQFRKNGTDWWVRESGKKTRRI